MKGNCKFLSVIWVKWKILACFITLPCSSNFYCLFIPFFVQEIFKFKYGKFSSDNLLPFPNSNDLNRHEGKVVSLSFQERFNWEKTRKNNNENNALCLPFIVFFSHKVHNIRFEKQIRILSQLTVIKIRPPVSESQLGFQSFMTPLTLKTNFIKQE